MPTIENAIIKKHNTFSFITYKFENLKIEINKKDLIMFLFEFYKEVTNISITNITTPFKQESVDRVNINDQFVTFYGDIDKREGFESIYKSKGSIQNNKFVGECSFFYIFEQTIKENFHIYFNIENCSRKTYLGENRIVVINEIVVYMANFFNENEETYNKLFNKTLSIIDNFIK